ncbi:MAG: DUF433 domain-containing protein [Candidatus Heimdallarchaeota archaeon]
MHPFQERIAINPRVLGGKPVIKGTRIPIYIILQMLRDGATFEKIIEEYPDLKEEDIQAIFDYMLYLTDPSNEEVILLKQEV